MMAFVCVLCAQHTHAAWHVAHAPGWKACAGVEPAPCHRAGWHQGPMQEQPFLDKNERRCAKRRAAASCSGVGVELMMCMKAHDEKTLGAGARAVRGVCSVISYPINCQLMSAPSAAELRGLGGVQKGGHHREERVRIALGWHE